MATKTTATETQKTEPTVSVTLLKPHTHKGVVLPVGEKIDVTEKTAVWLKAHGVIQ